MLSLWIGGDTAALAQGNPGRPESPSNSGEVADSPPTGQSHTAVLPPGQLVAKIAYGLDQSESYAAYLAESAAPNQPLPVLFVFDPAARGALAVETFREMAEAHGMLLVGSNDSRNGPYERNFDIVNRLFSEIFNTYTIDGERVFLSGFSGGSRLAASVAILTGQIAGVIGCGAAFDSAAGYIPPPGADFLYVGVIGYQDMNFLEMGYAEEWLDRLAIENKRITFEGGHRWPDPGELLRAMDWIMQAGHAQKGMPLKKSRIDAGLERALQAARNYKRAGRLVDAIREYRDIQELYANLYALDSIPWAIDEIRDSDTYRELVNRMEGLAGEEEAWTTRFRGLAEAILQRGSDREYGKWEAAWGRFRKKYDADTAPLIADMQKRVEGFVFAFCIERANALRTDGNYDESLKLSRLLTIAFPDRPYAWVRAAEDHARLENEQEVFHALGKAVSLGFSDRAALEARAAFAPYIGRDAWHSLFGGVADVPD